MSWNQQCHTMKDSEFLIWLWDRLYLVYDANINMNFMINLKQIALEIQKQEQSPKCQP